MTGLPLEVGQCFNKELLYSLDLIRQSLFRDKEMDDIHQGITEVTDGYREVEGKRDLFRESVMGVLEWLDSTFVSCDKIKSKPYEVSFHYNYAELASLLKYLYSEFFLILSILSNHLTTSGTCTDYMFRDCVLKALLESKL